MDSICFAKIDIYLINISLITTEEKKESPKKEDDYISSINAISFVILMVCSLIMMIPFLFIITHFVIDFP